MNVEKVAALLVISSFFSYSLEFIMIWSYDKGQSQTPQLALQEKHTSGPISDSNDPLRDLPPLPPVNSTGLKPLPVPEGTNNYNVVQLPTEYNEVNKNIETFETVVREKNHYTEHKVDSYNPYKLISNKPQIIKVNKANIPRRVVVLVPNPNYKKSIAPPVASVTNNLKFVSNTNALQYPANNFTQSKPMIRPAEPVK